MPPAPPSIHRSFPVVLIALRTLAPVDASDSAVVVSMEALPLTRAMTRLMDADDEVVRLTTPPSAASYPVARRKLPSADRVRSPSDEEVPLAISLLFEPLTTVGKATD